MSWVLEHIPSGKFMPEIHRGYSHLTVRDFVQLEGDTVPPRLFPTKRAAGNAKTAYLMGAHTNEVKRTTDWLGDDDVVTRHIKEDPSRKSEDFAVTKVSVRRSECP